MANITGRVTCNGKLVLEVDADPAAGAGTVAPIGSLAMASISPYGVLFLKYAAANTAWVAIDPVNPTAESVLFDDFIANMPAGNLGWDSVNTGAGTTPTTTAAGAEFVNKAQGSVVLSTGTLVTGRSAITLGTVMGLGYGPVSQLWRLDLPTLATGAQTYQFIMGLGDTTAGNNITQTNAVAFVYDIGVSTNWITRTIASGVTTSTTTATAVATGFNTFGINVNAAATSVAFTINGATVATHATNIPGFIEFVGPLAKINKSLGVTALTALIDYFYQKIAWSSAR